MMRGGLISMLYGKATEVGLTDVDTASSLTLMSADIERIVTGMETGHEVRDILPVISYCRERTCRCTYGMQISCHVRDCTIGETEPERSQPFGSSLSATHHLLFQHYLPVCVAPRMMMLILCFKRYGQTRSKLR
jgi:hypothetical protein